jgi:hypothetical protein
MLWKFQKRRRKNESFTLPLAGSSGAGPCVTTFRFWSNSMEYAKFACSKCSLIHSRMSYVPLSSILECFWTVHLNMQPPYECQPALVMRKLFSMHIVYMYFFMCIYSVTWVVRRQLVLVSAVVLFKWRNLKYVSCCRFTEYCSVEYLFVLLQFEFVYCSDI